MKKKKVLWIIAAFAIVLLIVCFLFLTFVRYGVLLDKYADQLYHIPLPPETVLVSQGKAAGNLFGTGRHLDFTANIEIESALSESELTEYYSQEASGIKPVDALSLIGLRPYDDMHIEHSVQHIEVIPKAQTKLIYSASKVYEKTDAVDPDIDENLFIVQLKDTHYGIWLDLGIVWE